VAAGLCIDKVMALFYLLLASLLASGYQDCDNDNDDPNPGGGEDGTNQDDDVGVVGRCKGKCNNPLLLMEALSHVITLAMVLTALGQFLNSQLCCLPSLVNGAPAKSLLLNPSLPITAPLAVLFLTYYLLDLFLSPTTMARPRDGHGNACGRRGGGNKVNNSNSITQAGQMLGTSLLYLFFATASALGWRLKDSKQKLFLSIASFLVVFYGIHRCILLGTRWLIICAATATLSLGGKDLEDNDGDDNNNDNEGRFFIRGKVGAPQ
jgi:hypothetical protein